MKSDLNQILDLWVTKVVGQRDVRCDVLGHIGNIENARETRKPQHEKHKYLTDPKLNGFDGNATGRLVDLHLLQDLVSQGQPAR